MSPSRKGRKRYFVTFAKAPAWTKVAESKSFDERTTDCVHCKSRQFAVAFAQGVATIIKKSAVVQEYAPVPSPSEAYGVEVSVARAPSFAFHRPDSAPLRFFSHRRLRARAPLALLRVCFTLALFGGLLEPAFGKSEPKRPPPASPEQMQLGNGRTAIFLAQKAPGPLVIFLHGGSGSASDSLANSGFATAARLAGVSLVFGNARDGLWHYEGLSWYQKKFTNDHSDEDYLLELRETLLARGYGSKGVFIAGFSNGGMVALQTVCNHPKLFAGVGLISSAMPEGVGESCGTLPTLLVAVNGVEDKVIPVKGGVGANADLGPFWSSARLGEALLHRRQCAKFQTVPVPEKSLDGQSVVLLRAAKCKVPGRTDIYAVLGGEHGGYSDESEEARQHGAASLFLAPQVILQAFVGGKSKK